MQRKVSGRDSGISFLPKLVRENNTGRRRRSPNIGYSHGFGHFFQSPRDWDIFSGRSLMADAVACSEALMATQTRPEGKARSFGENIESDLALEFLRIVEVAAIASARTMGQGERKLSDQVATEAMRQTMQTIPMRG